MFQIGDTFFKENRCDSRLESYYNLVCVDNNPLVALIGVQSCNRWRRPVKVKDVMAITQKEFEKIADGNAGEFKKCDRRIAVEWLLFQLK